MIFKNPLLAVTDMDKSKKFYKEVLGLEVVLDFGANVTLEGGICLQSKESWQELIRAKDKDIIFGAQNAELYFEEDDLPRFLEHLAQLAQVRYVHQPYEHSWGQKAVRIYDPDGHIIEIGENMKSVCRRFRLAGMDAQQIAVRMDVPIEYVRECLEE